MQKKMMILGASALQVPAIKKAKEMGYHVIAVDYDEHAVGFALADTCLLVSTLDQEEVYRQALIYKPDVVLTSTSDGPVRTAAYVNEKLGKKPDLSYEDSLCATIKSYMRDRLREKQVPIPRYFVVQSEEEFLEAARSISNRCMVKPADNAGSRGVVLLESKDEAEMLETYHYSKGNSRNGIVMVEEVMEGPEVSVEALTVSGETTVITITDKITTPPPFFVEIGHSEPSQLPEETKDAIIKVVKQAVKAIGLENGPSHTEIMITQEGPKVVELAARLGGDFITSKLVPLSTGVDMVGLSIELATGESIKIQPTLNRGSAICFLQGGSGVIRTLQVPKEVLEAEGIEEVVLYRKAGDCCDGTKSSNDRLGHVIATGKDGREALQRAKEATQKIVLEIQES